jgi:hypothetical protein
MTNPKPRKPATLTLVVTIPEFDFFDTFPWIEELADKAREQGGITKCVLKGVPTKTVDLLAEGKV